LISPPEINKNIVFKEQEHKYFNEKNEELLPVSRLISLFKPKFDPDGHIARACSKRDGITVTELRQKWEQTKIDGLARGTSLHRQLEHYIKTGEILEDDYKDVVQQFSLIKFSGKLYSEIGLNHPVLLIAGTCDVLEILDEKNSCNLLDFKSNKKIDKESKYGTKLLYPLDYLDDCEIITYGIQLNLYKLMLEFHGFKVKKMIMYHINPKTRNIDEYIIPKMDKEIKKLTEHYKEMMEF